MANRDQPKKHQARPYTVFSLIVAGCLIFGFVVGLIVFAFNSYNPEMREAPVEARESLYKDEEIPTGSFDDVRPTPTVEERMEQGQEKAQEKPQEDPQ